ncbi:MAG: hypothetical protein JWO83_4101 [Caulobacteraceae bacterium]|nr:hypothetical protein [Caulobacteraceae bacterium]
MSTAYSTAVFANKVPAGTGHGFYTLSAHLHATSGTISTWVAGDTINIGFLPANAVVVSATLKAASQLDSNGAPTLTLSLGVVGTPGLFKSAITTVGRAAGASADLTLAAAGALFKPASKTQVVVTVGTGAATPVAGTLEVDIEFYVEDPVGSNP